MREQCEPVETQKLQVAQQEHPGARQAEQPRQPQDPAPEQAARRRRSQQRPRRRRHRGAGHEARLGRRALERADQGAAARHATEVAEQQQIEAEGQLVAEIPAAEPNCGPIGVEEDPEVSQVRVADDQEEGDPVVNAGGIAVNGVELVLESGLEGVVRLWYFREGTEEEDDEDLSFLSPQELRNLGGGCLARVTRIAAGDQRRAFLEKVR